MSETTIAAATPAASPSHALPVNVAAAAAAKAPVSILPSRPMSTTPDRSDHKPARHARMSGTPSRMPEAKTTMKASKSSIACPSDWRRRSAPREQGGDGTAEHVLESAREQHDEALNDDDHVAADLRLLESELGAALIQYPEQDGGED